jgi:hypothetical protein
LIVKYFSDRNCLRFVTPTDDKEELKKLDTIPIKYLKKEFCDEVDILKHKIYKDSICKKIRGKKCNGISLALIIEEWVYSHNNKTIPNFLTIFNAVIENDIQHFYDSALKLYTTNIESLSVVMESEEIIKRLYEYKLEAIMKYNTIFNFDQDTFNNSEYFAKYKEKKRLLESEISKYESKIIDKNYNESYNMCEKLLEDSYKEIESKINEGNYNWKTYEEYLKDHES